MELEIFTTRPEIEGTFGVVTSTHWIATAVGMATLEKGGNAFDGMIGNLAWPGLLRMLDRDDPSYRT